MDDIAALLRRYALGTWRRRWIALGAAWLFCLAGWVAVMSLPSRYEASAQVYVAADPVLTPLLRGIAIGGGISSEVGLLQRTLLSRPNLEALIAKAGLLHGKDTVGAREAMVRSLAKTIRIVPETDNLLTIAYRDADPRRAYTIVQSLLGIFIERATGSDQSDVANAQRFLESQIALYRRKLRDTEQRRAAFLAKYIQLLPGADGSVSQFDAARATVRQLEGQLADAKAKGALLRSELAKTPPTVATAQGGGGSSANTAALTEAEQHLTELRQRYTDAYPAVIDARKLVAALSAQAAGKGTVAMPVVRQSLPNPVYDELQLQLIDATTGALSLERELKAAIAERDRLAALARSQPGLQAEFINLDRNYEVLRKQYQDLLTRQESMQITAAANIEANRVQLQVVNPPQMPTIPVAPPRELLLVAVLLAGLGGGAGLAVLLAHADSCSYTLQDLRNIGVPVAGGISLRRMQARRRRTLPALAFGAGLFLLVATFAGLVVGAGHLAGLA